MQRFLPLPLLLTVGALALAGCGDDGSDGGSTSSPAATSTAAQTTPEGFNDRAEVVMKGIAYSPSSITVRVGQRITWVNEDDVLHDVVSTDGERIESELFPNGESFSFTPTRTGSIHYICTIHPGMEGNITVE